MERLVYQMFILGTGNLDRALSKGLGGVILFTKDIQNKEQAKLLIQNIKSKSLISPFVSIDQEGGRVERTENIRPKRLSARYAFQKGTEFLRSQADEISAELKELGFNLNFAPCADVNTNFRNPIIGERAFSNEVEDVIKGVNICVDSLRRNDVIPCVKHYPGHGDADKDSHLTLPVIDLDLQEMENIHLKPFKSAIENKIEMVMAAHLHCTCFDKNSLPASLSQRAIGYLRNNLNYNGVVISDDMVMKGVKDFGSLDACIMGIKAGLDMFIFRESDDETLKLIDDLCEIVENDKILRERVEESNKRILDLKLRYGLI